MKVSISRQNRDVVGIPTFPTAARRPLPLVWGMWLQDHETRDSRRDHRVTVVRSRLLDRLRSLALWFVLRIALQVFPDKQRRDSQSCHAHQWVTNVRISFLVARQVERAIGPIDISTAVHVVESRCCIICIISHATLLRHVTSCWLNNLKLSTKYRNSRSFLVGICHCCVFYHTIYARFLHEYVNTRLFLRN